MARCGLGVLALPLALLKPVHSTYTVAQLNTLANATAAAIYDRKMVRAMATLTKLTYCGLGPRFGAPYGRAGPLRTTAQKSCGEPCEAAGFQLGPMVLVSAPDQGQLHADFAYVAALKRVDTRPLPADCAIAIRGTWVNPANIRFRGTTGNSRRDRESVLVDWPMPSCQGKGCEVHMGARTIWRAIEGGTVGALRKLQCNSTIVTGHSLGGQLAALAMFSLQDRYKFRVGLSYTFEASQPFNEATRSIFDGGLFDRPVSLFRITHTNDEIPVFPEVPGFVQPGYQVWFYGSASEDQYVHCGPMVQAPRCGINSVPHEVLCSLFEESNWKHCGGRAPYGGPHCRSPIAPAGSFCNMAGNNRAGFLGASVATCLLGHELRWISLLPTVPPGAFPVPSPWPVPWTAKAGAAANCFVAQTAYNPLGMLGHLATSQPSIQACQQHCRSIAGCEYISFWQDSGSCHVTGAWGTRVATAGATSGPKDCAVRLPEEHDVSWKAKMEGDYLASYMGHTNLSSPFSTAYTERGTGIVPTSPPTLAALGSLALVLGAAVAVLAARCRPASAQHTFLAVELEPELE